MFKSVIMMLIALPLFALAITIAGISLVPAIWVFHQIVAHGPGSGPYSSHWLHLLSQGLGLAAGFYVFGIAQTWVGPAFNFLLRTKVTPKRGPAVSPQFFNWYVHNAILLWIRYTFLEFITPTEYLTLFYRLMGMKIGKNVYINSTAITDPSIITLEDNVTIGGSASIIAHYSQSGYLIVAPVVIRRGATIGLRAIVMGGVEVGEKAKVLANSFVLPNTKIPAGETWGGIPAVRLELKRGTEANQKAEAKAETEEVEF